MSDTSLLLWASRLFFSSLALFFAIILFSRVRTKAFVLFILATLFFYLQVLYQFLLQVGILDPLVLNIFGFPIVTIVLDSICFILLATGFFVASKAKA